jgi:hypothetical protein
MNKTIDKLLQQKISRQEFLKTVGVGALALVGLSALVPSLRQPFKAKGRSSAYGIGKYTTGADGH